MKHIFPHCREGIDANHKARGIPRNLFTDIAKYFPKKITKKTKLYGPDGEVVDANVSHFVRARMSTAFARKLEYVFLNDNATFMPIGNRMETTSTCRAG